MLFSSSFRNQFFLSSWDLGILYILYKMSRYNSKIKRDLPASRCLIGILLVISPERRSHMRSARMRNWAVFNVNDHRKYSRNEGHGREGIKQVYLGMWLLRSGLMTSRIPIKCRLRGKGAVTRGNAFLQLATQRRFKLPFTREIGSCNTSSLQNNPTAGHTTTCICLQFYRSLKYLFTQICVPSCKKKLPRVTWP